MWPGSWRCSNRNHCGQARVNEVTLSRAVRCSERERVWGGTHSNANAHAAGCLAMLRHSVFSMKNQLVQIFVSAPCALMIGPLLPQIVTRRNMLLFKFIEKTEQRSIARHPAACAFASLCVPPRTRPLSLHRAAPLRVIPFARTHLRQSRLPHPQEPGCVHIRIAVHAPVHASPPAAARSPHEGYFTCANPSAAVPVAHPPPKRCAQARIFTSFHRIARACVCAPFRYRPYVRTGGDIPRDIC